jgi:hypothetical protein
MEHRPRRRTKIGGQFSPRLIEMLESHAWRALSLSGRRVLDRIEIELAHHGGADNGRLPVTYDNFVDYGIDRHAISPAIRETVALGFLEVTERGRAGNAEFRSPSLYRLTYIGGWRKADDPTHEWRRIQSMDRAIEIRAQARLGRQGSQSGIREKVAKKQKSSEDSRRVSVGETRTENHAVPVVKSPTSALVDKSTLLSISGDGARSALARSAVASAPSSALPGPSEEMLGLIMRSVGCTRAEAIKRFEALPNLNGADAQALRSTREAS